ncbi:hypothetical protein [Actinoplanes sp. NPDC051411]|jgi:hypothetical protein
MSAGPGWSGLSPATHSTITSYGLEDVAIETYLLTGAEKVASGNRNGNT